MSGKFARRLIDIGANLTDPMFRGIYNSSQRHPSDFESMLKRAQEGGVERMIITGGSLSESKQALSITEQGANLFSTVGCHPTRCSEFEAHDKGPSAYLNELRELACSNPTKIVAIGEIGLDYDRLHFCPKETQKMFFEKQLSLAEEIKLPLFLHNRNSIDDLVEILERHFQKSPQTTGVVHSFDGSQQDLERILNLGLYIGINGCSLKTEENLEVAKSIPSDRLMIETDCPWCEIRQTHASFKHVETKFEKSKTAMNPNFLVKNRNEPANLVQVLEVLATIRAEDKDTLAEQIWNNTNKLFFSKF